MYNLNFIKDKDLFNHVKETIEKYRISIDLKRFNKNLIDPVKLTFDYKIYKKSIEEVVELEVIRQMDKSNSNHIGYFQQNIFNYLYDKNKKITNWKVPKQGFDIVNEKENIFVEMKNKHNTMNSKSSTSTYIMMQNQILNNDKATCMLVEIISKSSQDTEWSISINNNKMSHKKIRRVSIDKFYELVTGEKEAFRQLMEILPKVIDDVIEEIGSCCIENTVIEELNEIDSNTLKSLYLLSFKKYEGFNNLNI